MIKILVIAFIMCGPVLSKNIGEKIGLDEKLNQLMGKNIAQVYLKKIKNLTTQYNKNRGNIKYFKKDIKNKKYVNSYKAFFKLKKIQILPKANFRNGIFSIKMLDNSFQITAKSYHLGGYIINGKLFHYNKNISLEENLNKISSLLNIKRVSLILNIIFGNVYADDANANDYLLAGIIAVMSTQKMEFDYDKMWGSFSTQDASMIKDDLVSKSNQICSYNSEYHAATDIGSWNNTSFFFAASYITDSSDPTKTEETIKELQEELESPSNLCNKIDRKIPAKLTKEENYTLINKLMKSGCPISMQNSATGIQDKLKQFCPAVTDNICQKICAPFIAANNPKSTCDILEDIRTCYNERKYLYTSINVSDETSEKRFKSYSQKSGLEYNRSRSK